MTGASGGPTAAFMGAELVHRLTPALRRRVAEDGPVVIEDAAGARGYATFAAPGENRVRVGVFDARAHAMGADPALVLLDGSLRDAAVWQQFWADVPMISAVLDLHLARHGGSPAVPEMELL